MEPDKKSNGAMVGSIIIILILIIGGLYVWKSKANKAPAPQDNTNKEQTSSLEEKELASLEQDLNGLDTSTGVNVDTLE